jgi:hypothetical protein
MSKGSKEQSIIREQTIEYIARQFADHRTGTQIATLLGSWGVPNSLIDFKNTKWRMLYDLFRYYSYSSDKKDHETLFKIIGEILHPLMFGGDKALSEKTARNFNKYLEYDGVVATYSNDDKKYYVYRKEDVDIDNQEIGKYWGQPPFISKGTALTVPFVYGRLSGPWITTYLSQNSVVVTPEFREPPRRPKSADFDIPARFRFPTQAKLFACYSHPRIFEDPYRGRLSGIEPESRAPQTLVLTITP